MSEPFLGEIRIFAGNFAPKGWATCDGQILSIAQNAALFSLLGTTYGGNGINNFALPNLAGRVPLHRGQGNGLTNRSLGETGGETGVALTQNQLPLHNHLAQAAAAAGTSSSPTTNVWAATAANRPVYINSNPTAPMPGSPVGATGGGQAHNNLQPYLALTFIIAMVGIYPSRS